MKAEQLTLELVFEQVNEEKNNIKNAGLSSCKKANGDKVNLISFDIELTKKNKYRFNFFTDQGVKGLDDRDYLEAIIDCLSDMEGNTLYWANELPRSIQWGEYIGLKPDGRFNLNDLNKYQPQFTKAANALKKYLG